MNAVIKPKDHYSAEFQRLAAELAGHEARWLRDFRAAALARFAFPTPHDEEWKYTRTAALEKRSWRCDPADGAIEAARLDALLGATAPRLVFINGRHLPQLSRLGSLGGGVRFAPLRDLLQKDPDELEGWYGKVAALDRHPFASLNSAFAEQGVYLEVAAGAAAESPLHVLFLSTAAQDGRAVHPRLALRLGAGAQATVVEHYFAVDNAMYFTNVVAEVVLGDNAVLEHYRVQEEAARAFHISSVHVRQGRDSRYRAYGASFANALLRNDIDVQVAAQGARCELTGLYFADGRGHVDVHTRIDHLKPHGTSSEFYKGILGGHGRGVFNGKVIVHPDAQKTDARQVNNNLLLSPDAEADAKPQLEIYADDVKCSHGATVGQLDADAVFYLRSRGMEEAAARRLLTHAFAAEIIEQARPPALRAYLEEALLVRLPKEHARENS